MYSKEYYQEKLKEDERLCLELVELVLKVELALSDNSKLIKKFEDLGLINEPDYNVLKNIERHWESWHQEKSFQLENLDLDIEHCKFMLERFF